MQQQHIGSDPIELCQEISFPGDVFFDAGTSSLYGFYADQLSAYRAKKAWGETLEDAFFLDPRTDFDLSVSSDLSLGEYGLTCSFTSACGRYAFWRITNNQAPEAQYVIETGHIPDSNTNGGNHLMAAPDLRPLLDLEGETTVRGPYQHSEERRRRFLSRVLHAINRLVP